MERVNLSANGFYATPKCGYDFAMDLSDVTAVGSTTLMPVGQPWIGRSCGCVASSFRKGHADRVGGAGVEH